MKIIRNKLRVSWSMLWVGVLLVTAQARANITPAAPLGDNMVLQRDCPVPIWGTGTPGEKVKVTFGWQTQTTQVKDNGCWQVRLDPLAASSEPAELRIEGKNTVTFRNVLVGETWFCSGQSNMYVGVSSVLDKDKEIAAADHPLLRIATVRNKEEVIRAAFDPQVKANMRWQVCTPQSVPGFSAVAYFFGRELLGEQKVPVGLIVAAVPGTRIEPWTNREGFATEPDLKKYVEEAEAARLAASLASSTAGPTSAPTTAVAQPRAPMTLYNALVSPVVPFAIRGVIWYQGEANYDDGPIYATKMKAQITGWRSVWGQGDFPFYFVQLAHSPIHRAQALALGVANTGMVTNIDTSDARDLHPPNKQDTGKRLAHLALARAYARAGEAQSPSFVNAEVQGAQIRLHFDHATDGLFWGEKNGLDPVKKMDRDSVDNFEVAARDGKFVRAEGKIENDVVVVSCKQITSPASLRYPAKTKLYLYNSAGLPVPSFAIDNPGTK